MSDSPDITPAMRRYAAELYRLQEHTEYVSLSELSEHLDVSAQAVSRMVRRLRAADLVDHERYQGARLTPSGTRAAMPALRRHRLIEVFLVEVMGYGWEEVHERADVLEPGIDAVFEQRIDVLTGHPTRCPHGDPIPSPEGEMPTLDDLSLVGLESGVTGTISRVRTHDADKLRYLEDIGLVPGVRFDLLSCAPFNGPLRLRYDQQDQVLGYELASHLWAEPDRRGGGG